MYLFHKRLAYCTPPVLSVENHFVPTLAWHNALARVQSTDVGRNPRRRISRQILTPILYPIAARLFPPNERHPVLNPLNLITQIHFRFTRISSPSPSPKPSSLLRNREPYHQNLEPRTPHPHPHRT